METNTLLTASFIVYTAFIVAVGIWSARKRKESDDDFVLANRELGPWVSALSASASAESGWVMLGLVGMAFNSGMSAFWIVPGIGAGYLFNWFVVADKLRKATAKYGAVTLPQYICHRFGLNSPSLRFIPVIIITLAMIGYVAAQMSGAGKAFEAVFHLPYWSGVLIGALIILAYTIVGGFRAICWTDVIQASFMIVALVGMPIIVYLKMGGWGPISETIGRLETADPELSLLTWSSGKTGYAMFGFLAGMLGIGLGYPGQPHILARYMALKDSESARQGGIIAFSWFLLVYIGAIFFGLFARAYFGELADAEQALPLAVASFLPPVLGGFIIAAIVAAICSTADSQLIVVSSTISRDVFGWRKHIDARSGGSLERLDKRTLLVVGLLSVLLALTARRNIYDFVLYNWGVLGAGFGPVIIMGLMWKKTTKAGAIAGMITGALVTVLWKNTETLSGYLYELVPAFVLAFAAIIVVSLATRTRAT